MGVGCCRGDAGVGPLAGAVFTFSMCSGGWWEGGGRQTRGEW